MHKTLFLLSALLFLSLSLKAQTKTDKADVNWGLEMDDNKDGTFNDVIDEDSDAVYQLISRKHDMFVQRMDLDMHVTYQKLLSLTFDKKKLSFAQAFLTKGNLVVLYSYYDKHMKEDQLYAATYARSDFAPEGRITKVVWRPGKGYPSTGFFDLAVSAGKSKVLIYMDKPTENKDEETYAMQVFDSEMQPIWSQDVTMPYPSHEFAMHQVEIDNDGSIVGLIKKFPAEHEAKDLKAAKKATYEHHLIVLSNGDQAFQDYPITVGGKFLQDMTMQMGTTGNIICGGLFSDPGTWGIRGTFFLGLDRQTKQIVHESYKDFSENFLTQYMTEKEMGETAKMAEKEGDQMESPNYTLHKIIQKEDGGAVMVAEQFSFVMGHTTSWRTNAQGFKTGTTDFTDYFIYNDIIVVSVDPLGNIEWASTFPKRQFSTDDGGIYSSYAVEVKGGNTFLVFNDCGENIQVKPGDKIKQFEVKGEDALVVLVTVDGDGNVTREALFSPEHRDVILRPKDCVELSNDKMMIYASSKKEYRFGEIEFK